MDERGAQRAAGLPCYSAVVGSIIITVVGWIAHLILPDAR